jgi:hypothetical protein
MKFLFLVHLALFTSNSVSGFTLPASGRVPVSLTPRGLVSYPVNSQTAWYTKSTKLYMSDATVSTTEGDSSKDEPLFEPIGRGIARDYGKRLPLYKSDITDGLNVQCLAATLFLFFACLAPAVGFGGLFGIATNGAIGTMEMVSSTAACGVIYALFSAQPLTIIGSTGPVLAFVATLAQLAKKLELPFLPLYAWTGIWTSLILLISSLTSASNLVKYLTRFTDEIFSLLISTIFVVEACSDVAGTFSSPTSTLTKALLTLVLASSTYVIATILKSLRTSVFFNKTVRNTISNFAPTIGVVTGCLLGRWARLVHGNPIAGLPSLSLPSTFATTSGRPWLIPLGDFPMWARWASIVPALMATVLLFLDQNITVRLVNNPQYKMKKGRRPNNVLDGMHGDMLVIALLTLGQSLIGFPWLVAATVRSISHVRALTVYDNDGKRSATIEQRVTGTCIHALIGCCVLLSKPRQLLTQVPMPVLMGLFMYLGTSALAGNEMWERVLGIFKDPSVAPKQRWTDKVPTKLTNIFTLTQVACLGAMFWVKESPIGVLFPVVIAMLAPIRFGMEKIGLVKKEYMDILDEE